ncbi:MAG TPA: metal ABC transporter ATP-binding protein [Streptosporangiaceae bacterium]|nr:metal ABC transporter ATP-binding protein [Streptosporangiaceae bacterium]
MTMTPVTVARSDRATDVLAIEDLGVRLGGRDILADVRFTIGAGEFVGLIGSNGAGKTTLLRVILGLAAPTTGTVSICGERRAARKGLVGYVPQKIQLDPDMPVRARDLVGLGLDGHKFGLPLPSRGRRQQVDEMLRAVGAARFADERVGNLSGGEQQRVMIAHALISSPRLLLLDEPLANLDISSAQEIIALLARVSSQRGVSVLISAHEMNPLLPVMDRIVYLAGGRAASGTTTEVVRSEVLSGLYGHHVDVIRVHGRVLVVAGTGDGLDIPAEAGAVGGAVGEAMAADHPPSLGEQVGHGRSLGHGSPDDGQPGDQA